MKSNKFVLLVAALLTLSCCRHGSGKTPGPQPLIIYSLNRDETLKGVKLQPVKEGVRKLPMITWRCIDHHYRHAGYLQERRTQC